MKKIYHLITSSLAASVITACGAQGASQTASVAADLSQLTSLFSQYTAAVKSPAFTANVAGLQKLDYTDLYSSLVASLDNSEHSIGNYQFRDQLKMTLSLKDAYQTVHDSYGSISKYPPVSGKMSGHLRA